MEPVIHALMEHGESLAMKHVLVTCVNIAINRQGNVRNVGLAIGAHTATTLVKLRTVKDQVLVKYRQAEHAMNVKSEDGDRCVRIIAQKNIVNIANSKQGIARNAKMAIGAYTVTENVCQNIANIATVIRIQAYAVDVMLTIGVTSVTTHARS